MITYGIYTYYDKLLNFYTRIMRHFALALFFLVNYSCLAFIRNAIIINLKKLSHKLEIDKHKFFSSGSWKSVELGLDKCEIRNVNGDAAINYWGSDPNHNQLKCVSSNHHQFPLDTGLYCVS